MRIELACLDMAGTTVADDGVVERAFVAAVPDLAESALDEVRRTMGSSKIVVFRRLLGDDRLAEDANRRFEAAYASFVADGDVRPLPGAAGAIAALRAQGVKVCLTTGFSHATQQILLESLGWASSIDLAITPGPGCRGRPFPDMILAALMRLEVDDVRAVAIAGDTTNDLLAGSRAGAGIVAGVLTGAHDRATLDTAPHTHLLASARELPELIATWN